MTAGYTEVELAALHRIMLDNQPADPSRDDIKTAPQITGIATAARYNGLFLKIMFQSNETLLLKINCVVASELMASISHACNGWAPSKPLQMLDAEIGILSTEGSLDVTSFASGADANGLPVNFTDGNRSVVVFLASPIAIKILAAINSAGESAGWWNKAFILQPARVPEELEIQQEAAQLISRYKETAAGEASRRAISALEVGDKFNHELWQQVAVAVREIERAMPADGNPLTNCVLPGP